jgi:hypothetical protein
VGVASRPIDVRIPAANGDFRLLIGRRGHQ